jgi:restriction system protein
VRKDPAMTQISTSLQASAAPTYADIKYAVRAIEDVPAARVRAMMNTIFEQDGSPQSRLDWSDPDRWIDERLAGDLQTLARKIWEGSGKTLNPRYFYKSYKFVTRLKLLQPVDGIYRLGERGRRFLAGDDAILRELVALRLSRRRPAGNR